jgi:hypothetical protein
MYIIFTILLFVFQSHFVYFPSREIVATPTDIGLHYEAVFFETKDRVKISGWFIPAERSRGVILFCHGNAGNISHRLNKIQIYNRIGLSTFIFDYRGYGESAGKPSEQGTYFDAEAAWDYLVSQRQISPEKIIIYGESLGGAVGAWLAQDRRAKALIMESTFTSIKDLGAHLYPYLPVRLLSRFSYNALDYLRKVHCPVLIIHSPEDEIVPNSQGRQLFEATNQSKDFLEIRGSHNEGFLQSAEVYEKGLDAFISKL